MPKAKTHIKPMVDARPSLRYSELARKTAKPPTININKKTKFLVFMSILFIQFISPFETLTSLLSGTRNECREQQAGYILFHCPSLIDAVAFTFFCLFLFCNALIRYSFILFSFLKPLFIKIVRKKKAAK